MRGGLRRSSPADGLAATLAAIAELRSALELGAPPATIRALVERAIGDHADTARRAA